MKREWPPRKTANRNDLTIFIISIKIKKGEKDGQSRAALLREESPSFTEQDNG